MKDIEPLNQCCSTRENVSTVIRNKARRMRDHAYNLEKLADRLDCLGLTGSDEETLWKEIVSKSF